MTTTELSRLTNVPRATLNLWVSQRILIPLSTAYGTGDAHTFGPDAVTQVLAIQGIRQMVGDGQAADLLLPQVAERVRRGVRSFTIPSVNIQVA